MARKPSSEIKEASVAPKPKAAVGAVFISHVHEDEALAEAFGMLIQSVTAGAVPTYRSSSKNLGEGIQYGKEWFDWIIESVNEASHTVALITPASTGRPWILFEAGLGKAKPDGTVFGLALGIERQDAYKGPFAVLQNCGTEKSELKKLCNQLIQGRNLNPPAEMIDRCVDDFRQKVTDHFKAQKAGKATVEDPIQVGVFQALEEMKLMLRDQQRMILEGDEARSFKARRRRPMLHPSLLDEMMMIMGRKPGDPLFLLMASSMVRDEAPWLYEICMETYRQASGGGDKARRALHDFFRTIDSIMDSPLRELFGESKELYHTVRMIEHYSMVQQQGLFDESPPKSNRIRKQSPKETS